MPSQPPRTTDVACTEAEMRQLLARGDLLLQTLSIQAHAARIDAMRAELELAMADAREGHASGLAEWLARYQNGAEHAEHGLTLGERGRRFDSAETVSPHSAVTRDTPSTDLSLLHLDSNSDLLETAALPKPNATWDDLLPGARLRLRRLVQSTPQLADEAGDPACVNHDSVDASVRHSVADSSGETDDNDALTSRRSGHTRKQLAAIAETCSVPQKKRERARNAPLSVWRSRGFLASVAAHGLLLLVLALVTLKMATPPASLSFNVNHISPVESVLELTQPLEPSLPRELDESSIPPEPAFEMSELVVDVESSMRSALGELPAPPLQGVANAARAASAGQSPLNADASFFGASASGNCFCYVIDASGSMRDGPWEAAKMELRRSLLSLQENQRFYIIFFNRELSAISMPGERTPAPRALYATQENLEHARRWIETLRIGIGGPPNDALEFAIAREPDAIYLLTDGVTTVDVAKFLRQKNRVHDVIFGEQVLVPIHTIAFYSLEGQQLLKTIAGENRGKFIYVPDPRR